MVKVAEIFRVIIDGVRKQQISSVTMIFYKKNNINTVRQNTETFFDCRQKRHLSHIFVVFGRI